MLHTFTAHKHGEQKYNCTLSKRNTEEKPACGTMAITPLSLGSFHLRHTVPQRVQQGTGVGRNCSDIGRDHVSFGEILCL